MIASWDTLKSDQELLADTNWCWLQMLYECLTKEVNRNCPKYSPWLYICDVSCSILLGYQHRCKDLTSLSWLVSCSGQGLKCILHPDAGLGGMVLAVHISWWHIPIPQNRAKFHSLQGPTICFKTQTVRINEPGKISCHKKTWGIIPTETNWELFQPWGLPGLPWGCLWGST